jgi:drug/metabolite transporter (DMT)-like permease
MEYAFIIGSLFFVTLGQLLQKLGANKAGAMPGDTHFILKVFGLWETYWAMASLAIGIVLWLAVLYYMEVSKAFPFLSAGFVLIMLVSHYYLHETITPSRWWGVILIVLGIALVAQA